MAKSTALIKANNKKKKARKAAQAALINTPSCTQSGTNVSTSATSPTEVNVTPPTIISQERVGRPTKRKPWLARSGKKSIPESAAKASSSRTAGKYDADFISNINQNGAQEPTQNTAKKQKCKPALFPRKGTRANPGKPTRTTKPIEKYEAIPGKLFKRDGHNAWDSTFAENEKLKTDKSNLTKEKKSLRRELVESQKENIRLNELILMPAESQPGDYRTIRFDDSYSEKESQTEPSMDVSHVKEFVKSVMSSANKEVSSSTLENVFTALGLDRSGTVTTKEAKKDDFVRGIRTLMSIHFKAYDEKERADILGEMLFNARIFSKESSLQASIKATRTIASCIFNVAALLKTIDSTAGSLNDTAVQEYAEIEDSFHCTTKRGHGILRKRHYLTRARKIANGLVDHLFKFVDGKDEDPLIRDCEGREDMVMFEPSQLFRFLMNIFKLKQKAMQGNMLYAITGDGAALTTSTNNAGQCAFGFKIIDKAAINPCTGEPLICRYTESDEGNESEFVYHGAQSTECCIVTGACLMSESQALKSKCFTSLANFALALEKEGMPTREEDDQADDTEEAIPPQKGMLVGCGDLCFQRKLAGNLGGGCKVADFFCTHCETQSLKNNDLLAYATGDDICDRCRRNSRSTCAHRPVNDKLELHRKGLELIRLLREDYSSVHKKADATIYDMLPNHEVECFDNIKW